MKGQNHLVYPIMSHLFLFLRDYGLPQMEQPVTFTMTHLEMLKYIWQSVFFDSKYFVYPQKKRWFCNTIATSCAVEGSHDPKIEIRRKWYIFHGHVWQELNMECPGSLIIRMRTVKNLMWFGSEWAESTIIYTFQTVVCGF